MKFNKLNEDTIGQRIEKEAEAIADASGVDNAEVVSYKGDIEKALDRALRTNLENQEEGSSEFQSVLLVGQAGVGKTARVKAWCKENGMHLVQKNAQTMDIADLGGLYAPNEHKTRAINLPNGAFDELDTPNTVLFLDEFNRATTQVRFTLAQLIDEHKIPDSTEKGSYKYFDNLVLVIAAINPADFGVYNTEPLDAAELNRFTHVSVQPDKVSNLQYLKKYYTEKMNKAQEAGNIDRYNRAMGKLRLAEILLKSREFEFDDAEEIAANVEIQAPILTPRSLTRALDNSDGTKEDLLDLWNSMCNPNKKSTVERILAQYKDIDNKANSVFKKRESENYKKIMNALNNL